MCTYASVHVCVHAFVYVDLIYVWPYTLRGAYHVTSDTSDKVVSYLWNVGDLKKAYLEC